MHFKPAPLPNSEIERAADVASLGVMRIDQTSIYLDYVSLAAELTDCPMSFINLLDQASQWSLCGLGLPQQIFDQFREIPRDQSICQYALLSKEPTIISDLENDLIFSKHPIVTEEPHIRFYAGFPLVSKRGNVLGTLCLMDLKPRLIDEALIPAIQKLARRVAFQLEFAREKNRSDFEFFVDIVGTCKESLGNLSLDELLFGLKYTDGQNLKDLSSEISEELVRLGFVKFSNGDPCLCDEFLLVRDKFMNRLEPRKVFKVDNDYIDSIFSES
ncbi:MAG: GAF domain-containing protein [Alphaproteobacteria bacterium]